MAIGVRGGPEGGCAKLLFRIIDADNPSEPAIERMWVTVPVREGDFYTADPESARPDAWCDECHKEFMRAGSWEAPGVRAPKVRLVCGGCYDALKRRHGRSSSADNVG